MYVPKATFGDIFPHIESFLVFFFPYIFFSNDLLFSLPASFSERFLFFFFFQMMKDVPEEQANRIFRSCDRQGDGQISLEEFKLVTSKGRPKQPEATTPEKE